MEYAGLSTHPGQTGPSVSPERQVAPRPFFGLGVAEVGTILAVVLVTVV